MTNTNNNHDDKKQAIIDKLQKVLNEDKDNNGSGSVIDNSFQKLESDLSLEKRRIELEKEINEINELLAKNGYGSSQLGRIGNKEKKTWYNDYPILNSLFTHPDFNEWQKFTSIMSIVGLVMGGLHGYSEGKKYIKDSIAKSIHNPLSISSIQLNQKKTLGIMVFRSSLIFSYRCGLYTSTFLGVEYLLKNNVFERDSILNRTLAGTAIGILSAVHMRKRGNMVIPVSLFMGTSIGFATGCADFIVDKVFKKYDEIVKPSE